VGSAARRQPQGTVIRTENRRPADHQNVRKVPESNNAKGCFERYFAELDERVESGFDPSISLSADVRELTEPVGALKELFLRICQAIDQQLGDADLSFGTYLRDRRLERCRSDLTSQRAENTLKRPGHLQSTSFTH